MNVSVQIREKRVFKVTSEKAKVYKMYADIGFFWTFSFGMLAGLSFVAINDNAYKYCQEHYPTIASWTDNIRERGRNIRGFFERGFKLPPREEQPFHLEDLTEFMKTHPFWDEWERSQKK